ncbi:MAG: serine/threonine protein kinase [Myxococcales bacterium]|nr:serine/threonine protein kinase [Myxococcales bacterium]
MKELLLSPIGLGGAALVVVIIAVLILRRVLTPRAKGPAKPQRVPGDVQRYVRDGNFGRAATAAANAGLLELARDYYLRAQQPENAAAMSARLGDYRQAAELFERAGATAKAISYYERAGMGQKVTELSAKSPTHIAAEAKSAMAHSNGRTLETEFRALAAKRDQSEAARAQLQALARRAADALLAEGEMSVAAGIYNEAGLYEEAVHLYVNVLGKPGQAAPILAQLGHHERAAELFEQAGETEQAAATWIGIARGAKQPEAYIDRIEHLSPPQAQTFLEEETQRRGMGPDTVELFYRLAQLLNALSEQVRALEIYHQIEQAVPGYKETVVRIKDLARMVQTGVGRGGGAGTGAGWTGASASAAAGQGSGAGADALTLLSAEQLQMLADQVAQAAAAQLRRANSLDFGAIAISHTGTSVKTVIKEGVGLEISKLELDLAFDAAVQAARQGASIDTLMRFTGGRECDLGNIEVYYRLGLAHMAGGNWADAAKAFDAVEDASPGYRDAWKRAEEVRVWEQAIGDKRTRLGKAEEGGGRYELRGELGRGGMAIVYRGYDTVLDREVALKFLSSEMSAIAEVRDMFQREGRAVAALNHPNIVTIHDVGVLDGRAFLCMEFVAGRSVESLMTDPNGLTIVEGLNIATQVLTALAYAHSRRIIHRDIKPANFMRTDDGLVKLMDFGLAKSIDSGRQQSMIAGTPQYMAPEQLRGELVDARTDLFSVAVTMYELFTGHMPFEGMERHAAPKPPNEYVPALPDLLNDAVMRGLAFSPNARWQSAEEMREPIASILDAVGSVTRGAVKVTPVTDPVMASASTELLL